ncbi:uncharacterized protein LOC114741415 [Neltuma alba]|uniref:uncharacterized protein LOC114741415 n=1 Tax=Neltuma alba TaxID=207710 RepID=UPI0010A40D86|nr:uncharacterized protein LOC114741415 [Prosopis alba]
MASSSSKVSLKSLIDTNAERVLFAEASKEFVDFLFNLFRFPVGTMTTLLATNGMVGGLGKLYESPENLSDDYLHNPKQGKDIVLKPRSPFVSGYLLPASVYQKVNANSGALHLYMCGRRCSNAMTYAMNTARPSCGYGMNCAVRFVGSVENTTGVKDSSEGEGSFVKGVVTYTVMDDLQVRPMSTISAITMISKFNVKEITSLEERVVINMC